MPQDADINEREKLSVALENARTIEYLKYDLDLKRSLLIINQQNHLKALEYEKDAAFNMARSCLLLNGGALTLIITFLTNSVKISAINFTVIQMPIMILVFGLLLSLMMLAGLHGKGIVESHKSMTTGMDAAMKINSVAEIGILKSNAMGLYRIYLLAFCASQASFIVGIVWVCNALSKP